jgi:hypothetical protein
MKPGCGQTAAPDGSQFICNRHRPKWRPWVSLIATGITTNWRGDGRALTQALFDQSQTIPRANYFVNS